MNLSEIIESAKIVFKYQYVQPLTKEQEYAFEQALRHAILQERGACLEMIEKREDKYIVNGILR